MRIPLIAAAVALVAAVPATAQRGDSVEQRIERIEQQLRAVQRRVFPGGRDQFVEPEIRPDTAPAQAANPAGDALANLTARVDSLEAQLRSLTNQVEEQGHRSRQLEQAVRELRTAFEARAAQSEPAAPDAAPAEGPSTESREGDPPQPDTAAETPPETPAETPFATAETAETVYNQGYRLWVARRYPEAQQALAAAAERYPDTAWTSWMRNLEGRAYLDDGKPATAARIFLANYQDNPDGERAADSLFYLGQALTRLGRMPEACRVYAELEQVYPNMRPTLRTGLPQARADARCGEAAASR